MSDKSTSGKSGLEDRILEYVYRDGYQPVKPKVIAKKLGLADADGRKAVRKAVKKLVKKGKLSYGASHRVHRGGDQEKAREVVGRFRRLRKGDGLVIPSSLPGRPQLGPIFISQRRSLDASTGDTVRVRLQRSRVEPGERLRGAVVEVLERETHRFVGTYAEPGGIGVVTVDGNVFAQPIPVGDPGAKNVAPGDKVVIDLVRFPSHAHAGEAVIVEVLGRKGQPGVDTLTVMREYDLPDEFPEEVLDAGHAVAEAFTEEVPEDRRDLTSWPIVTIDPVDARDFDDAISLSRLENGNWQLGVHIADVAHFVRPKSVLDAEAKHRATSVYLPDRVIPMLPETISNLVASLQPDRIRLARTVVMEITPEGTRLHTEVFRSAIRSCRRFTYEEVDEYLADRESWRERLTPEVHELLGFMHELAMVLRQRRLDRGAIELHLPEVKIDLDKDGRVVGAHKVEHTESHQIIEEFMLAANEAVAETLSDQEVAYLRRLHPAPDPKKLRALTQFIRALGYECQSLESRFEIKRILEEVRGKPEEAAVNLAVLKSMQKAVYGPEDIGHYALNMTHYCHFTSPIRRYPDLTVHRLFDLLEAGKQPPRDPTPLYVLGEHCSDREQRAEDAERELVKIKLMLLLSEKIGERLPAVVTGVEEFGLFVQGTELPAEGLVHISTLHDDYYHYDEQMHALIGHRQGNHFRLGDVVEVEVVRVDVDRREVDFRLVRHLERAATERKTARELTAEQRPSGRKRRTKKGGGRRPGSGKGRRRR